MQKNNARLLQEPGVDDLGRVYSVVSSAEREFALGFSLFAGQAPDWRAGPFRNPLERTPGKDRYVKPKATSKGSLNMELKYNSSAVKNCVAAPVDGGLR